MGRLRINEAKYRPGVAGRFKLTRQTAGLTLSVTAELMKVNLSYIKAVEYGNLSPNIDFLINWHKTFKTDYKWMLEGKR